MPESNAPEDKSSSTDRSGFVSANQYDDLPEHEFDCPNCGDPTYRPGADCPDCFLEERGGR